MWDKEKEREWRRKKYEEEFKPTYDMFIALYPFTTESLDGEIWKPIPNYEELYHGSNFGRVKSFKRKNPKIMKPSLSNEGYLYVGLNKNGKQKGFRLNILVATLFIPNPENKPEVNHRYSRFSNFVDCLEWATGSENVQHAVRTGLKKTGEDCSWAKLTNEQARYIRENPDGLAIKQLAKMFGVDDAQIGKIQLGERYKNAGGSICEKIDRRIPDEMREQILARYNAGGISQRALAKEFGVGLRTVGRIVNGK